ncbi:hypothetical protein A0U91_10090 [Acetobacter persici]|uniref:Uncharacterized protein n=1 Tax=Acetobacter persici TaxID=1076596 RepID=A0A1U9LFL9_9PROT|nr:hypothetical protein A0U91_10090 [Acetobacter persici]
MTKKNDIFHQRRLFSRHRLWNEMQPRLNDVVEYCKVEQYQKAKKRGEKHFSQMRRLWYNNGLLLLKTKKSI